MTKADLKTGMFGVMSDGKKFVIVDDKIVYKNGGYDLLRTLKNDLRFGECYSIDYLVKAPSFDSMDYFLGNKKGWANHIIFDRKEIAETVMTIAEIEQKLGIKNLRIKGE